MSSRRRNILFLTHRVPFPPDKGDKIRTFHQLDHLAVNHDVYCACFIDCPDDRVHAIALKRWCKEVFTVEWNRGVGIRRGLRSLLSDKPLTLAAYEDWRMRGQLAAWSLTVEFDAAVAFSACMAPFAQEVKARRRVLDLCDSDSAKWMDYAASSRFPYSTIHGIEGRRLRRFELGCLDRFDATVVISERERHELDPAGRHSRLHVIGNGVDLPFALPPRAAAQGPIVSFVGDMGYRPNCDGIVWFAKRAWPEVRRRIADAQLVIVGRNPTVEVAGLGKIPGVTVTGTVPDVRRYLVSSRVVVAPLHIARGMPNKVLEAMAMQRPVVATQAVADCLGMESGRQILCADSASTFANHVTRLLGSNSLCDQIADAGYRHAAAYHSWADTMRQYEELLLPEDRRQSNQAQIVPERRFGGTSLERKTRSDFGRPIQTLTGMPFSGTGGRRATTGGKTQV